MAFTITRSSTAGGDTTVRWDTNECCGSTATSGVDFQASGGIATLSGTNTSTQVTVPINGDTIIEDDEIFGVQLSNPTNGTITDAVGFGEVVDDDTPPPPPAVSISDAELNEGNSGMANMTFTITRSDTAGNTTTSVQYGTSDGSANAGSDYVTSAGPASITGSDLTTTVTVPVNGDAIDEADEWFAVRISNPVNGWLESDTGIGSIIDDDLPPGPPISADVASVNEGNSGTVGLTFTLTRDGTAGNTASTVQYQTQNLEAVAGQDYQGTMGTATFAPSATQTQVTVLVNGDTADEADVERFRLALSSPTNGSVEGDGIGRVIDDDAPSGGGGGGGGNPVVDTTPPGTTLSGKERQRAGPTTSVGVSCTEACSADAVGKLSVPGGASLAKTFTIRSKTTSIPAGAKRTLKLKLIRKVLSAVKKALRKRRRVSARITVTAKDAAGNTTRKVTRIRLKR